MASVGGKRCFFIARVETAVWTGAAKKADKWRRGVPEAAERFMVKRDNDEANLRRQRHASFLSSRVAP